MQSGLLGRNLSFYAVSSWARKVEVMAELKWYRILKVLFGTILSIADPITDILTLREFYRAGHKTWFGVGVTTIIFPTLFFLYGNFNIETDRDRGQWTAWKCIRVLVLGCNPLLPALLKLRTLISYLKKLLNLRQGSNSDHRSPITGRSRSWISSSVYYSVVRHGCSTGIGVDRSNGFPTRVFP